MFPGKDSHLFTAGTTLALAIYLLFCTLLVHAEDPDQEYNSLPLTNTERVQSTDNQAEAARLSDLLKLKESVSDMLPPEPDIQESDNDEQLEASGLAKRVFCNGFTGCAVRPRTRRRRVKRPISELLSLSKRPFCNSYGCYNSGRKRFGQSTLKNKDESIRVQPPKETSVIDGWPWVRMKKLFCNGYGGCQNMGKRLKQLNSDVEKEGSSGQRVSSSLSKMLKSGGGKKRFISSDFDDDFNSFIDSFRR